ncbi:SDR family NAD(P)-dependent oxidoreductase, partial [Streptomyces sp. MMG1121]|uniref:SDR family NAD(P)-dependent oxidoreductase n=1 Tax=Streptomyces sp. MMG1121 TaxID=1415544 RepID=UPI0006C5E8B8
DWSAGAVSLLTEAVDWPEAAGRPRRAGVSSFGMSGTNAHVIVEEAPPAPAVPDTAAPSDSPAVDGAAAASGGAAPPLPWLLSAPDRNALLAQARQLRSFVAERTELSPLDAAYSLATTRASLDRRAVVTAGDRDQLLGGLDALLLGTPSAAVTEGAVADGKVAFLFTGQGAQRPGMGRELYVAHPAFATAFDAVCAELDPHLDRPVKDLVFGPDAAPLDRTGYAQPALFAVEVALFRLLESWGVRPDYLLGHSIGELTAAHAAGVFSLADACRLVAARGRLMEALPAGGAMVALQATEDEVRASLDELRASLDSHQEQAGCIDIAAVNGPHATVISGLDESVSHVAGQWAAQGRKVKRLRVSHAFHSPLMDPMLADFREVAQAVEYGAPSIPVVSDLTGTVASSQEIGTPEYWVRHVREAVRFHDGMRFLESQQTRTYVELGPAGVLSAMGQDCLADGPGAALVPALRADRPEDESLVAALAAVHVRGVDVDWQAVFEGSGPRRTDLPTYAFQRQRYWPTATASAAVPGDAASSPTGDRTEDAAPFWDAVERVDHRSLAAMLEVRDDQPLSDVLPALSDWRRRQREQRTVNGWRYRIAWKPVDVPPPAPVLTGTWLILVPAEPGDHPLVEGAVRALTERGASARTLRVRDGADLSAELRTGMADPDAGLVAGGPPAGVLSLLGLDDTPGDEGPATTRGGLATVALLAALADTGLQAPLWCATRGAVAVGPAEPTASALQGQLWGLGRVMALERPASWGGLVDLPETWDEPSRARFAAVLTGAHGEDQLALRRGGLYARRLVRAAAAPAGPAWRPRGTVLITGGTGALGARVARRLAEHGAEHLVLVSRRGRSAPGVADLEGELTSLGTKVTVAECDVTDRAALATLVHGLRDTGAPIRAVVHAAGAAEYPAAHTDLTAHAAVVCAKVAGALHLDDILGDEPLDAFVLFSSIAAVWGSGGQGSYAAANAYLDALAEQRRARGRVATSVAWGPWDEGGMAGAAEDHLRRRGLSPLAPRTALDALQSAVADGAPCVVVADVDWARFAPGFTATRPGPLLGDLPEVRAAADATGRDGSAGAGPAPRPAERLAERLLAAREADREQLVLDLVREHAAAALGHTSPAGVGIEPDRAFRDLGFDSLAAVDFRNRLAGATGLPLATTVVFDHPTPAGLARHLRTELLGVAAHSGPRTGSNTASGPGTGASRAPLELIGELESALRALAEDDAARAHIGGRLHRLLTAFNEHPADARATADEEVDTASADELFELIQQEFGKS